MIGKIKFFNETKGFGFIIGEDNKEYFVHITDVNDSTILEEDDNVSFEVIEGDRGPKASRVSKN